MSCLYLNISVPTMSLWPLFTFHSLPWNTDYSCESILHVHISPEPLKVSGWKKGTLWFLPDSASDWGQLCSHIESVPFTWCDSQTLSGYAKFTLTYTYTLVSLSIKLELSMVIFNESIETIVGDVNSEEDGINLKWTWLAKNHHQNMNN